MCSVNEPFMPFVIKSTLFLFGFAPLMSSHEPFNLRVKAKPIWILVQNRGDASQVRDFIFTIVLFGYHLISRSNSHSTWHPTWFARWDDDWLSKTIEKRGNEPSLFLSLTNPISKQVPAPRRRHPLTIVPPILSSLSRLLAPNSSPS